MEKELKLYMQMATSDVYSRPDFPIVHIYIEDEEIGTLTIDGEVVDGDFGADFLDYTRIHLEQNREKLMEDWLLVKSEVKR